MTWTPIIVEFRKSFVCVNQSFGSLHPQMGPSENKASPLVEMMIVLGTPTTFF